MTKYGYHPSVLSTSLSHEVVALQLDTRRYYTMNETAGCVWRALSSEATEDDIVRALTSEYDVDTASARTHVKATLDDLIRWRLIACR